MPEFIEVFNPSGTRTALLSPDADGLKDVYIDNTLNGSCVLTAELPLASTKWGELIALSRIKAGGREFVLAQENDKEKARKGPKKTGKITAQESWILLGRKFVTVSNDPNTPDPAWSQVVIVSGGTPSGGFAAGSAGSALSYVLAGSGWTVGTVDVTGTFDLETEQVSVLANINQIQKLWGGVLVWDSLNKTVSLRDETTYQPYYGTQFRYAKNLKDITRNDDDRIVTRLYPFGADGLNIGSVNGGVIYLDNTSFSTELLEDKWINQDISDAQQLKDKATAILAKLCKPRYNYKIGIVDLRELPGYNAGTEDFEIAYMVDVVDPDIGSDRVRVIRHKYNMFQRQICEVEIGDPLEKLENRLADTNQLADKFGNITNGSNQMTGNALVPLSVIADKIAASAVDASKMNVGIIFLAGDIWTNNSPGAGYVAWNQHKLAWDGTEYTIQAGNTNSKYIYWDTAAPGTAYQFAALTSSIPKTAFIIGINNGGTYEMYWNKGWAEKMIDSALLGDGAVVSTKLADLAVEAGKLANSAVTAQKIANLAVGSAAINDLAVTSAKLADLAVTAAKIANAAVGSAAIANAAVGEAHIANASINSAHIQELAVVSAKIGDLAVNTLKIGDRAVTGDKVANFIVCNDPAITYTGVGWSGTVGWSQAVKNTVNLTATARDYLEYTFTSDYIGVIFGRRYDCGKVDIYIDSVFEITLDIYTDNLRFGSRQVLWGKTFSISGTHTIKIEARADKNASSTGYVVPFNAFVTQKLLNLSSTDYFFLTAVHTVLLDGYGYGEFDPTNVVGYDRIAILGVYQASPSIRTNTPRASFMWAPDKIYCYDGAISGVTLTMYVTCMYCKT